MLARLLEFDEFSLDCDRYELLRSGRPVKLEKIPMELLILLVTKDGRLVTRQEIIEHLWGTEVFVDTEHGINTAIRKIRNVLRDDPEQPRFVQTVPRKGYRFIAPINVIPQEGGNGDHSATDLLPPDTTQTQTDLRGLSPLTQSHHGLSGLLRRAALVLVGVIGVVVVLVGLDVRGVRKRLFAHTMEPSVHSLAVLPLKNLSGDPAQDYFADGVTEQLITGLGQVKVLRVISHTSVNQYKVTSKTIPEIARELQVDALVEGTVTSSEGRIRVTANLVQAFPEKHLWANTYDRDLHDVLSLQGEISRAIARAVRVQLTPEERDSFATSHPTNLEAQEAYLKGLFYFVHGKDQLFVREVGKQELHKANDNFQRAIAIDPQFALAYAGLARSYLWLTILEGPPALAAARVASENAISLDDTVAEGHMVRGYVLLAGDPDWAGAERELLRSIELNPSYAEAHQAYGIYLSCKGRFDDATAEAERAVALDPVSRSPKTQAALIDIAAGHYEKGITRLENITGMFPGDALSHEGLGVAYVLRGRFEEGIGELRSSAALGGKNPNQDERLGWAYAVDGKRERAIRILQELKRISGREVETKYKVAVIYAGLGDNDQVFLWLDKAYAQQHDVLNELWREPAFISLRADPRFRLLLHKIGVAV